MKSKLIMLLAVVFCLGGAAQALDQVVTEVYSITGDSVITPNGNIFMFDVSDNPQAYKIRIWIENDGQLGGSTTGFEFSSPDGATWVLDEAPASTFAGGTPNGTHPFQGITGSRWMSGAYGTDGSCWDAGGTLISDGLIPDQVMIGGVAFGTGLAAGPLEHMLDLYFSPVVAVDDPVRTLCFDSAFYPPGGQFLFAYSNGTNVVPQFTGGCYSVSYKPVSDADDKSGVPATFSLSQNHPNPFNPETSIEFSVARKTHVEIAVFNVLGQRVKTLVDEELNAGVHDVPWDGTDNTNNQVASGIYFYKMVTDDFVETRKMALMR